MHVAMVNRMVGFTRGGGEIWDLEMAEHLRDLGVEVTMVYAAPLQGEPPDPVTDIPAEQVRTPHFQERALAAPRGVGGLLADVDAHLFVSRVVDHLDGRDEFDIVHVNSRPEFARYRRRFDQPLVLKLNGPPHSLWYDRLGPFRSSYDLIEQFDAVVTTGVTADDIEANTDHDRVVPINPGVDTDHFRPAASQTLVDTPPIDTEAQSPLRLLFVGRFVPSKNLPLLVDAVGALREQTDVDLVLVGDGPLRTEIEDHVAERGLRDVVRFEGYVDNEELPAYYRRADAFVLSSRTENCPITILEAMSCGTPVVAPRLGWIPHLVEDGADGLLYEVGSVQALVAALKSVATDHPNRREMGRRARMKAVDRFDWTHRATRLRTLYEDLLAG